MWPVSMRSAALVLAAVLALTAPALAQIRVTPPPARPAAPASRLPAAELGGPSPAAGLRPAAQGTGAAPGARPDSSGGRLWAPEMAGRMQPRVAARSDDSLVKAIESGMRCTCGCNLDVFTCRTTDFTCTTSPAMHRLVLARLDSGMTAAQVVDAFQRQYGESVMMAPPKHGFNWAAYVMPFVGLLFGLVIVALVIRGWFRVQPRQPLEGAAEAAPADAPGDPAATDDELQRLRQELERFEA
jgi:cytochrome c-type biogenesis protein CcmH/NrfF